MKPIFPSEFKSYQDQQFLNRAKSQPFLTRAEEVAYAIAWRSKEDAKARDILVNSHMRLVIATAAKFRNYGLPLMDLVSEGTAGLMEGINRFETEKGVRLGTYALWWIKAAMQDYIIHNWSAVRLGTSSKQKALFFNLRRIKARLGITGSTVLTPRQRDIIALSLQVTPGDVLLVDQRFSQPDKSLNAPLNEADEDSGQFQDSLVDDAPTPADIVMSFDEADRRHEWLMQGMKDAGLSDREIRILVARRLQEKPETLEALGTELGISKERVRQLEVRVFEKVQRAVCARAELPVPLALPPGRRQLDRPALAAPAPEGDEFNPN